MDIILEILECIYYLFKKKQSSIDNYNYDINDCNFSKCCLIQCEYMNTSNDTLNIRCISELKESPDDISPGLLNILTDFILNKNNLLDNYEMINCEHDYKECAKYNIKSYIFRNTVSNELQYSECINDDIDNTYIEISGTNKEDVNKICQYLECRVNLQTIINI